MSPLILWIVWRLGYDPRALRAQSVLGWLVLPLSRLLTGPASNVNWVFALPGNRQMISPGLHLACLMILYPLLVCWPIHFLLPRALSRLQSPGFRNARQ